MTNEHDVLPFEPAVPLAQLPAVQSYLQALADAQKQCKLRQSQWHNPKVSTSALRLLELAVNQPFVPLARLWAQIGQVSVSAQRTARKQLEHYQLMAFVEPRIEKANVQLGALRENGWRLLNRQPTYLLGHRTLEHVHGAYWIKWHHQKQGRAAHVEWPVLKTAHIADVGVQLGERWHVYELVMTCDRNIIDHLTACFCQTDVVETVSIVTCQKKQLVPLKDMVNAQAHLAPYRDRIVYETLEPYLRSVFP